MAPRSGSLAAALFVIGSLVTWGAGPAGAVDSGGTLSRGGLTMTTASPHVEVHFHDASTPGEASQLIIVSDTPITLAGGYSTNGASTGVPGICSDSNPDGAQQIRQCGLLSDGSFTLLTTSLSDSIVAQCSGPEQMCPQPMKILAGRGNDVVSVDNDTDVIDIECGLGNDTVTALGPYDTMNGCEHRPDAISCRARAGKPYLATNGVGGRWVKVKVRVVCPRELVMDGLKVKGFVSYHTTAGTYVKYGPTVSKTVKHPSAEENEPLQVTVTIQQACDDSALVTWRGWASGAYKDLGDENYTELVPKIGPTVDLPCSPITDR